MARLPVPSLLKTRPVTLFALVLGATGAMLIVVGVLSRGPGAGSPGPDGTVETVAATLSPPPRPAEEVAAGRAPATVPSSAPVRDAAQRARDPDAASVPPVPAPQDLSDAGSVAAPLGAEAPPAPVSDPGVAENPAEAATAPEPDPPGKPRPRRPDAAASPKAGAQVPPQPGAPPTPKPPSQMGLLRSSDWILRQDADAYTIQLLAVRKLEGLRTLVRGLHADLELAYFVSHRKGRDWYVLIAGVFPNREAALAASKALPASLRGGPPWIRRMSGVQRAIRPIPG